MTRTPLIPTFFFVFSFVRRVSSKIDDDVTTPGSWNSFQESLDHVTVAMLAEVVEARFAPTHQPMV
jgi:hypothetical protein